MQGLAVGDKKSILEFKLELKVELIMKVLNEVVFLIPKRNQHVTSKNKKINFLNIYSLYVA